MAKYEIDEIAFESKKADRGYTAAWDRLYILNMIDHWSREERKEYVDLTAERERLRNGRDLR